ncbi:MULTISPECIES: methionine ABC transporter ATP-binding protein [Sinorhizobium]|uniref:Cell division ATP-binding protein FtsE n=1 Tax=Sinorhizobium mexicanum TaxID=375549 RepID=A0A859QJF8_9HYPH|nr:MULTISPECIES: methionine ABC transporter ATP-binding protein [Sinorhizobium]MBP1885432.1 D-methionine transport system ATP-binding protein [Sinorhizobium mexicanum]MDK1375374.1 methionine ABC transporter ATP-binding protein [Sinorhizobium sp. 6-70]MDK1477958.1 methionine ABC transporter ATP-binding protein [Sinorhizobium sp. 6-117]QLL63245.1 methionine ABC transporter ATP-binding protein [Sinorhizobium mexicanum]
MTFPSSEPSAGDAAVVFDGVSKRFAASGKSGAFTALNNVSLAVGRGSITGIIGRSGAGKSTLIRLVNGLEKPSSGKVLVDGVDVGGLDEAGLRNLRRSVGMIFQHFNLLSSRTVFGNVALPLEIAGMDRRAIEARVRPLLDLVGLADKHARYPAELSGGQKQRIGIARALATEPKLLLSDEATSALDPETTQSILELLKRINAELGLTVLLITHEMEVVKAVTSDVAVIDKGEIVERGHTFDVFTHPKHETTRALLSGLPGSKLPDAVARGLKPAASAGDRAVVRLTFFGATAERPLISQLIKSVGAEVNIIAGTIDEIGGKPYGSLVVAYAADAETSGRAERFFTENGLVTEVLGYVA